MTQSEAMKQLKDAGSQTESVKQYFHQTEASDKSKVPNKAEMLPLGSIVVLKDGEKKLMIYGRGQLAANSGQGYDYIACLWPEGNLDEEFMYLFNNSDINTVFHHGYTDAEDTEFLEYLGW